MALLDEIGEPLTFEEVKRLVEAASPLIELQLATCGKGRFLVAKKALKAGEVILSEFPLFDGSTTACQSKKACKDEVKAQINELTVEERLDQFADEDAMHPCSPLVDCIAGILLARWQATNSKDKTERARCKLKIRQFASLARTCVSEELSEENAKTILDLFSSEMVGGLDCNGLRSLLQGISSNRFAGIDGQLDLMFAGSMFEHSCDPNCFAGNWKRSAHQPRLYRAMRDIEVGEALSISYLQLPDLYLPADGRAKLLAGWGFRCTCTRCTGQPELTRAFVCPQCKLSELCPARAGADNQELKCLKCNCVADADYARKCHDIEALLDRLAEGVEELSQTAGTENGDADVIGSFHHASFRVSWQTMQEGPSSEDLFHYAGAIEHMIDCLTRLHADDRHPDLLELYHIMAALTTGNIEDQQHYLELERATLLRHYPEEAERQDEEIWNLVQGRGPHSAKNREAESDLSPTTAESAPDLSCMD
jgi:hypothetical protein